MYINYVYITLSYQKSDYCAECGQEAVWAQTGGSPGNELLLWEKRSMQHDPTHVMWTRPEWDGGQIA